MYKNADKNFYNFPIFIDIICMILILSFHRYFLINTQVAIMIAGTFSLFAIKNLYKSIFVFKNIEFITKPVIITKKWLFERSRKKPEEIYIGKGFIWEQEHAQRYRNCFYAKTPKKTNLLIKEGNPYIHGVGAYRESDKCLKTEIMNGHTSIAGTTGAGKTWLLELLARQAINRTPKEAVVIFDPKGDEDLLNGIYTAAVDAGRKEDFKFISPIHPQRSSAFNPIYSYLKPTDIATRITGILPQDSKSKPFVDFCFGVLVDVISCIELIELRPTLDNVRRYTLRDMKSLLDKVGQHFGFDFQRELAKPEEKRAPVPGKSESQNHHIYELVANLKARIDHPGEHFSKMILSLDPVLLSLTTHEYKDLLSPQIPDVTWKEALQKKQIIYFYLGAMVDTTVAENIGKLIIQDFLFHVGMSYASGKKKTITNLFIDETYNVVYNGIVNLLNKSRGAGVRVVLNVQVAADIEAVLDEAKAAQILGNTNIKLIMRTTQSDLAEDFSKIFGKTVIEYEIEENKYSGDLSKMVDVSYGKRLMQEEVDLVRPEWISGLPMGELFLYCQGSAPMKIRVPITDRIKEPNIDYLKRVTAINADDAIDVKISSASKDNKLWENIN